MHGNIVHQRKYHEWWRYTCTLGLNCVFYWPMFVFKALGTIKICLSTIHHPFVHSSGYESRTRTRAVRWKVQHRWWEGLKEAQTVLALSLSLSLLLIHASHSSLCNDIDPVFWSRYLCRSVVKSSEEKEKENAPTLCGILEYLFIHLDASDSMLGNANNTDDTFIEVTAFPSECNHVCACLHAKIVPKLG